ncbi:MAG: U32 family peptidase [Clostridia bacterium]|nr:U32 family peptidase [Clostridia bacterium]
MKKTMELLAPVGGFEQLEYAIKFGADAVYLAGKQFGMRANANNFDSQELERAIAIAHDAGVKIYITCNTLVSQNELDEVRKFLEFLNRAKPDAVIVGDIGVMSIARETLQDVAIHVSTQASVANAEAARTYHELGAKRIICAREMSLENIAQMRKDIPADLELEVFVHGAMCMSYSGRCMISDYLCQRPAQKGACTQPCRWQWNVEGGEFDASQDSAKSQDENLHNTELRLQLSEPTRPGETFEVAQDEKSTYIFNSYDMCMLEHLDELRQAGVNSIKIEGRNKNAYYVATIVNAYRQVLDGAPASDYIAELDKVSHRPYSTGFFFSKPNQSTTQGGYQQIWKWCGVIDDCKNIDDPATPYQYQITCRNNFNCEDTLETLNIDSSIKALKIANIQEITEDGPIQVDAANKVMRKYLIECDTELFKGALIRKRV